MMRKTAPNSPSHNPYRQYTHIDFVAILSRHKQLRHVITHVSRSKVNFTNSVHENTKSAAIIINKSHTTFRLMSKSTKMILNSEKNISDLYFRSVQEKIPHLDTSTEKTLIPTSQPDSPQLNH